MDPWEHFKYWLEKLADKISSDYEARFNVAKLSGLIQHLLDSVLILCFAGLVLFIFRLFLKRVEARFDRVRGAAYRRKIETITSLAFSTAKYCVYIASLLWILAVWGVDTQSLVVGTAVIGAAVGFGSQGLVQDVITGLSILAEEQLSVGDFVEISGKAGVVEEVGLRVIKLRDTLGVQHVIFNRSIGMVSNYSGAGVQTMIDVPLRDMASAEAASRVGAKVCQDLAAEIPFLLAVPEVDGVQQSSTGDVFLRLKLCVVPQQQNLVNEMFVDRIKRAFAAEKIILPDGGVRVIVLSDHFKRAMRKVSPAALPPSTEKIIEGAV